MSQTLILIIGFLVIIAVNAIVVWVFVRKRDQEGTEDKGLSLVLQQINELSRTVDHKIGESSKTLFESTQAQSRESQRLIKEITEELTKVQETGKRVEGFADELQNLQDILQNPKQRGELGEYYLEAVLRDVFPPGRYQMQYAFQNGEVVDAVIFLQDKIVPIDSKFSLENYKRILETRDAGEREQLEKTFKMDLKKRIDETSKYVRPQEGTMEFAFMFIPAEGIYYDLLSNKVGTMKTSTRDLIEYAFEKKVIIVSPTSFLAYLQTVMQGLKSLQIEEQAKEIQKRVGELGRHLKNHEEFMVKLGNALGTTVNHYNRAHKELNKMDKDILRIAGEAPGIEQLVIDKPQKDD